jgi:hypothetical protein
MIDCTGQCESATAATTLNGLLNQTIYCTLLSYCLMPDNFAHQGESAGSQCVKTVKCDINRIFNLKVSFNVCQLIISINAK